MLFLTSSHSVPQTNPGTAVSQPIPAQAPVWRGINSELQQGAWMTMALVALEEIVNRQQEQGTTVVCRSQTAPITHLEPAAQTARGEVEPLVLRSATGCRDGGALAQTEQPELPCVCTNPTLLVTLMWLNSSHFSRTNIFLVPFHLFWCTNSSSAGLFATTPTHPVAPWFNHSAWGWRSASGGGEESHTLRHVFTYPG